MKKVIIIFIFLIGSMLVRAQEMNDLWISNSTILQNGNTTKNGVEGKILMDLGINKIEYINADTKIDISSNRKKTKLKIRGVKGKFRIQKQGQNKLVLITSKNSSHVFERLDLTHKLNMSKKELSDFLIKQQCDLVGEIKGQFTKEQFFLDKKAKKPTSRYQFINFSERDNGYWYIKTIKGNAFLIFNTAQKEKENIFQIIEVKVNGFKLLPLQEQNSLSDLTWIKACL
jgi:hypothetical protein